MSRRTDSFDLGRLSLSSGEGRRLELEALVDPFTFGGQRYGVADRTVDVVVDVSHTTSGYALRLRFDGQLEGPCMRCLGEAAHTVTVDAREIDQPGDDDELRSPYLEEQELDLRGWVRDSLALALPTQIICRAECLGLCGVCGVNLNEAGPEHRHDPAPDPRWQALRELRLD
ncbi:MAG TPA: DUF177 domain-containing protein [Thermoleophilaceae bacterium]|nr:DUF177 domain-containing protein [Thermoleophilaceae bacterium]